MNKKISGYKAVVFDLDGTLYYQRKVRLIMAGRLFGYYICRLNRLNELFTVSKFRKIRERVRTDEEAYLLTASAMKTDDESVRKIIRYWMYEIPLDAVAGAGDKELADIIARLRGLGKKIFIFSDYPTEDKLRALGISVDASYSACDERVNELKPSAKALRLIMEDHSLEAADILMVGDRMEKDGQAAINAGIDYLILPAERSRRSLMYREIF